jgi:hypothetical protein
MSVLEVYRRAGFPARHGEACQEVANELDRIIISRCAQEIGIQLLEESYASKGFGIKAKSCDWGPFAGFAMGHFQFSKFETGLERYQKQIQFFRDGADHTGFQNATVHLSMAEPDVLRLTTDRLSYLAARGKIRLPRGVSDGELLLCDGPYGPLAFWLKKMAGASPACWAIAQKVSVPAPLKQLAQANQGVVGVDDTTSWGKVDLVKGMVNLLPEDRNLSDPAKNCVAGDYDLWAVFPNKKSSMAKHGMDRQARIFAGVNPNASQGIKDRVKDLQQDALDRAPERTHVKMVDGRPETFRYQEDPEMGNVSALVFDTMNALNRRIRAKGYLGGRMVHHNDDMGNPHRSGVEKQLIAFVPRKGAYFIDGGSYYEFIRPYKEEYAVYDNPAIWGVR